MDLESVIRLNKDLTNATSTLSQNEARYLVDAYYQIQEYRKATGNQVRALNDSEEPHAVIDWMFKQVEVLESQLKRALDSWTNSNVMGQWAKSITGVGPVISAGLLAHIDITKAPTAGHIWSYAGLNPQAKWEKGQLRPWNAELKRLCWLIGESFVKVSNNPKDFYGKLYKERKEYEQVKNEEGDYAEQAKNILDTKKIGKETDAYKSYSQGKLPPAHIQQRAKRYAVKIFLSHWHHVAYENYYNECPPAPFAISILKHAHMIEIPNHECICKP